MCSFLSNSKTSINSFIHHKYLFKMWNRRITIVLTKAICLSLMHWLNHRFASQMKEHYLSNIIRINKKRNISSHSEIFHNVTHWLRLLTISYSHNMIPQQVIIQQKKKKRYISDSKINSHIAIKSFHFSKIINIKNTGPCNLIDISFAYVHCFVLTVNFQHADAFIIIKKTKIKIK